MTTFQDHLLSGFVLALGIALGACAWWHEGVTSTAHVEPVLRPLLDENRSVDCGAVSLYVATRLQGMRVTLDELRSRTRTTVVGTTMLNLKDAAQDLGFQAEACQCSFQRLHEHVLPRRSMCAIVYSPKSHFCAVVRSNDRHKVRLVDPAFGVKDVTEDDLRYMLEWDGVALLLTAP